MIGMDTILPLQGALKRIDMKYTSDEVEVLVL